MHIAQGRYSSVSEYVRELIRADEKREAEEHLETPSVRRFARRGSGIYGRGLANHSPGSLSPGEEGRKEPYLTGRVYRRSAARPDLVEHYCYLGENAGEAVADEVLGRVEGSRHSAVEQ